MRTLLIALALAAARAEGPEAARSGAAGAWTAAVASRLPGRRTLGRAAQLAPMVYVVFDLETTGFFAEVHAPIEIGAVKFRIEPTGWPRVLGEFRTLVDPGHPIPGVVQRLTGITPRAVSGAPSVRDALSAFLAFCADADFLVAHNAPFDVSFLAVHSRAAGLPPLEKPVLDTQALARALHPRRTDYSNAGLFQDLALGQTGTLHRGLDDARMTMALLASFVRELADRKDGVPGEVSVEELDGLARPVRAVELAARYFPEGEPFPDGGPLPVDPASALSETQKRLYLAGRSSRLLDVAREMGVRYQDLARAMRERASLSEIEGAEAR